MCMCNTFILIGLSFPVLFSSSFPSLFQRSFSFLSKSNMTESEGKKGQLNEHITTQSLLSQFIYLITKTLSHYYLQVCLQLSQPFHSRWLNLYACYNKSMKTIVYYGLWSRILFSDNFQNFNLDSKVKKNLNILFYDLASIIYENEWKGKQSRNDYVTCLNQIIK